MTPSNRVAGMDLSPIRLFAEAAPPGAIPLGVGEPTWDLPLPARKVLNAFSGVCRYGSGNGLPILRAAIGEHYQVSSDKVMVSAGSQGALFSLLQAWLDPGHGILLPNPGFVTYRLLAQYTGVRPLYYQLNEAEGFRLDVDLLISRLDNNSAKAVIVNHPANPTGAGVSGEDLARLADACRRRDILLISDEVYRDLYLGERPAGLRDVSDYGVVVSSVSKAWGAPGLRVGWAIADNHLLEPARRVHAYAVTSAAYINQLAAVALIEHTATVHAEARAHLKLRWEAVEKAIRLHMGLAVTPPDGSFYCWLRLPDFASDDYAFCTRLRDDAKVVMIPGSVFGSGGQGYARLSFAAMPSQVDEGIRKIAPYFLDSTLSSKDA